MNKVKPTPKQAKALELIREGKNPTQAMRAAGFSAATASHPKENLLQSAGAQTILEQYKAEYARVGITQQYLAAKTAQWLEATKPSNAAILLTKDGKTIKAEEQGLIEVPDYQTQLKAAEMVRKDWGLGQPEVVNNTQNNLIVSDEQLKRILGD